MTGSETPDMNGCPMHVPEGREIEVIGSEARAAMAASTGGQPLLDFAGESTPYVDYESIDTLLDLQHPRSGTHDEMAFYIMGQVKELLFKLMHHELVEIQRQVRADDLAGAFDGFRRIAPIQDQLTASWNVLATLTPNEFNAFRDHLGRASGFQSYMYRHLEFILGNKVKALLKPHQGIASVYPGLKLACESPSLYDDVIALLARRGLAIDEQALDRDWSERYVPNASVEDAWLEVYRDPRNDNDLYVLGEHLMDVADRYKQWRYRHLIGVERILGSKPGTGGTDGVGWLRTIVRHEFFPEMWSVRARL